MCRTYVLVACAFLFLSFTRTAKGSFDIFPEYRSLTEEETKQVDDPGRLNSEYESDVLAYTPDFEWGVDWLTHKNEFDLTAGSLNYNQLMLERRAKYIGNMTPNSEFKFVNFEQSDFEQEEERTIVELAWWFYRNCHGESTEGEPESQKNSKKICTPEKGTQGLAVYGEVPHLKRQADLGVAYTYYLSDNHAVRGFFTLVDFPRKEHNAESDYPPQGKEPLTLGFVGRGLGENGMIEYFVRHEPLSVLNTPDKHTRYKHHKSTLGFTIFGRTGPRQTIGAKFQADRKREYLSSSTPSDVVTKRVFTLARYSQRLESLDGRVRLRPGIHFAWREWRSNLSTYTMYDITPHIWVDYDFYAQTEASFEYNSPLPNMQRLKVGYDVTLHSKHGRWIETTPPASEPHGISENSVQQRLNLAYEFAIAPRIGATILLTFDADSITQSNMFQGGNGQFRFYF